MAHDHKDHKSAPQQGKLQDAARGAAELHGHERVDAIMPWIHRGELEDEDRDLVNEELTKSPVFQAKLAQESDLAAALGELAAEEAEQSAEDAEAAWAKFKTRLPKESLPQKSLPERSSPVAEDAPPQPHPLARARPIGAARTSAWRRFRLPKTTLGWLATAQTAALAALALLFIPGKIEPQEGEYRLLSSDDPTAQAPAGNVALMLDPASDQATMQALLAQAGARVVNGPMANGGYVLAIDPDRLEAGLATLQASEAVVLAQPLSGESAP